MILGIGVDIQGVELFKVSKHRVSSPFIVSHFTEQEIDYSLSHGEGRISEHLAGRYAAKESLIKALDQARGNNHQGVSRLDFHEMEVLLDDSKRPYFKLHGAIEAATKEVGVEKIHLSISHDEDNAIAMVVVEGV